MTEKSKVQIHQSASILLDLFVRIQRMNRFISTGPHSVLSLLETHLLIELSVLLEMEDSVTAQQLSVLTGINYKQTCRALQDMTSHGFVHQKESNKDKRAKLLTITRPGKRTLEVIDKFADEMLSNAFSRLPKKHLLAVEALYKSLSDSAQIPSIEFSRTEHPLRKEQRRITRALGLLHRKAFFADCSSVHFQLFYLLEKNTHPLSATEISDILSIEQSNLSHILKGFVERKHVQKVPNLEDARIFHFSLTEDGRIYFRKIKNQSVSALEKLLSQTPDSIRNQGLKALTAYCQVSNEEVVQSDPMKCYLGTNETLRVRMVEQIFASGHIQYLPSTLCGSKSTTYYLGEQCFPKVIVHLIREGKLSTLTCASWRKDIKSLAKIGSYVTGVLEAERNRGFQVRVEFTPVEKALQAS